MKLSLTLALVSLTTAVASAGEPAGYYSRTIFADDFSGSGFGPRWGHYKSGSVVKVPDTASSVWPSGAALAT